MERKNTRALQEKYFLAVLPLIRRIARRKLKGVSTDSVEDIVQKVSLNLWKWNTRRGKNESPASDTIDKDLSPEEWLKIASVATRHELILYYRSKSRREVQFPESEMLFAPPNDHNFSGGGGSSNLPGNSRVEMASLLTQVWKAFQKLSLRQKFAFIFRNEEFITDLISHECCAKQEIAYSLELPLDEFDIILADLPLTDEAIQALIEKQMGKKVSIKQIWKARGKAKAKLYERLKDLLL